MSTIHLKIITPKKIVLEEDVASVTLTTAEGEITVLPRHAQLLALLVEGVMKIKKQHGEEYLAIGGGYLETDGKVLQILVSRAHGQSEIDQQLTQQAFAEAKKVLEQTKDQTERYQATAIMRRSLIDLKLLKRHPPSRSTPSI